LARKHKTVTAYTAAVFSCRDNIGDRIVFTTFLVMCVLAAVRHVPRNSRQGQIPSALQPASRLLLPYNIYMTRVVLFCLYVN